VVIWRDLVWVRRCVAELKIYSHGADSERGDGAEI
jgi:hypothetical protein